MHEYCTVAELATHLNMTPDDRTTFLLQTACSTASRRVDSHCTRVDGRRRRFWRDETATARSFALASSGEVKIDDAWQIASVATDTNLDGTYAQAWTANDYLTWPYDGIGPNGQTGWPITRLEAVRDLYFGWTSYPRPRYPLVRVTAKWGWQVVPDEVRMATRLLAAAVYLAKDSVFGAVGVAELGITTVQMPPMVTELLHDYSSGGVKVA